MVWSNQIPDVYQGHAFGDVVPQKVRPNSGLDSVHMQNDFICVGPASQTDMTVSYAYNV
jgi:hypothetical protein